MVISGNMITKSKRLSTCMIVKRGRKGGGRSQMGEKKGLVGMDFFHEALGAF
jgi:hypothetical protein